MITYVVDKGHYSEVLSRCEKVKHDLWIGTADLKDLYVGFSYSVREKDMVVNYIHNQKEHHRRLTFAEEYRAFLEENGIEVDERFFMKDE